MTHDHVCCGCGEAHLVALYDAEIETLKQKISAQAQRITFLEIKKKKEHYT